MPLDITEYQSLSQDAQGRPVPVGHEPMRAFQQVAVGASSVSSSPLNDVTRFVRLHTDVTCRVRYTPPGTNAVAATLTNSHRLVAGATEFFGVQPGGVFTVIQST